MWKTKAHKKKFWHKNKLRVLALSWEKGKGKNKILSKTERKKKSELNHTEVEVEEEGGEVGGRETFFNLSE